MEDRFASFVRERGPLLRRALVARYGVDIGLDATDEALLKAWRNWSQVSEMTNPVGYLFRVGQSAARPHLRWRSRKASLNFPPEGLHDNTKDRTDLFDALRRLNNDQRVAVILVKAHGHTYAEAAEALGVTKAALGNYLRRGLQALRDQLGEYA